MKVVIYIEKNDFDAFFQWINRLNNGNLCHPPVPYYIEKDDAKEPLQLIVEPEFYSLIQDAEADLKKLHKDFGPMELEYDPTSISWELRTIADILRNSRRLDIEADVVYTALFTAAEVPDISPTEALIIAEREWLEKRDIS
jgi:hypothetical protein